MNIYTHITKTFKIASAFGVFALALAQGGTFGNLEYQLQNHGGYPPAYKVRITGWNGAPTNLVVPSTIDDPEYGELEVYAIQYAAFKDCTSLIQITLPDELEYISSEVFKGCTKLTSVTLPSSLNNLDSNAFEGCTSLTQIALPDDLTYISGEAFKGCTKLTSITLPASLNSIESNAFEGCTSLTQITLPNELTQITSGAFKGCTSLASITLPASLNSIGSNAFEGCTSLTQITLPAETNTIDWETFQGCDNLATITLGADFEGIGYNEGYVEDSEALAEEFNELPKLTNINVSASNEDFESVDGVLYSKDKSELIAFPAGRTGNFVIPGHVKIIGESAFSNSKLTSITISDTVTHIDEYAFEGASQLQSISIPDKFATELGVMRLPGQLALATLIKSATNNGLATRSELPQAVEKVLADIEASLGPAPIITSDLANMTLPRGKAMTYSTTTNFNATAFSAVGLPLGLNPKSEVE